MDTETLRNYEKRIDYFESVTLSRGATTSAASCPQRRPAVFIDRELEFVSEGDAPGISAYRATLARVLAGSEVTKLPHETIIAKLDEAGKTFRALLLKTNMTIPYTSVFLQLECR